MMTMTRHGIAAVYIGFVVSKYVIGACDVYHLLWCGNTLV